MAENRMKDLARHMRRAKVAPKKRAKKNRGEASTRFPPLVTPQIEAESAAQPGGLTEIPDSWDPKHRPEVEQAAREARKELEEQAKHGEPRVEEGDVDDGMVVEVRRMRVRRDKRRRNTLSFSVSDEEEAIIRAFLADKHTSFSAWARTTLFRAMGKRVPARPKRS